MLLYNTATRKKEEFQAQNKDRVNVYVCGITAYDYCHIGHARSAVVFDVLVRHLRRRGYTVNFIRNFTDIDDKIIARAQKEGRDWREVGRTYADAFHEDMDRLNVLRADLEPRATDYVEKIQELCQKLIDAGKAYVSPAGDVYFRVRNYPPYGELSQQSLDDMSAGASARVALNEEKEDPLDFAVWKSAKEGEPSFPSPWGAGRPGWHIECSAMTWDWIPLDIHGGGQDLIFPHHENEKAQTEAALNVPLARLWMHNGFVQINHEKMSKSLGNFKTIRDILQSYLPETLRFFLLGKHYRSPIDFSFDEMDESERGQRRIYQCLLDVDKALARSKWKKKALPPEFHEEWKKLTLAFEAALDDDLNTAQALGEVFSLVRLMNRLLEDSSLRSSEEAKVLFENFMAFREILEKALGICQEDPESFFTKLRNIRVQRRGIDLARVSELLKARSAARLAKDFTRSDALREELKELGVQVQDTAEGQKWDLD